MATILLAQMIFRKDFSRLSKAESAETIVGEERSRERRWNRIFSLVAQPKEYGGLGIQPFVSYNRALNGMKMASIGFSWMKTKTFKKIIIYIYFLYNYSSLESPTCWDTERRYVPCPSNCYKFHVATVVTPWFQWVPCSFRFDRASRSLGSLTRIW